MLSTQASILVVSAMVGGRGHEGGERRRGGSCSRAMEEVQKCKSDRVCDEGATVKRKHALIA